MYIRPYKQENTRSDKTRVSQDLCELRPTKRFKKDDYYTNFPEYIANLHLFHSGLGGRDPYNRYIEGDCEGEDSWETASESSLSSDTSSLSWEQQCSANFKKSAAGTIRQYLVLLIQAKRQA